MQSAFSIAREMAHAAVAVVGVLAASAGLIVSILETLGVHVSEAQVLMELGVIGGGAALLSKLIDSVHNAVTTRPPAG